MKKLLFIALCAAVAMISCKNKGKTDESPTKADTLAAVIDSIIEEADTTPMPMFLMGSDKEGYLQMLYWSYIEEPQKTEENEDWFDESHQSWALQDMFRRNRADYTNLLDGDKIIKLKYVDEVLEDPDGNRPSIGERHGRDEIPSLCARYTYANAKDKPKDGYWGGTVVVTDAYLQSRTRLSVNYDQSEWDKPKPLPQAIVKQLESQYGMKAEGMRLCATIGDRYTWGKLQFKGEYKNAPKDKYNTDTKYALALDVLIDSAKVYVNEVLGYYDPSYGATFNADDDGEYVGCRILEAFEGPKGLELCYERDAPESSAVGMFYTRGGQLIQYCYETYHNMIDEEIPVWKSDLAEMEKKFVLTNPGEYKDIHFTKWAHCWIAYCPDEFLWVRDKKDEYGAFFSRDDKGQFHLIAVETPRLKPSKMQKGNAGYLRLSGSAGGPATYTEIFAFREGKVAETFTALAVAGELDECDLNGKTISNEEGQAYLDNIGDFEPMEFYGHDTENP